MKKDIYQERYLAHQKRKGESLTSTYGSKAFRKYNKKEQKVFFDILKSRRSQRSFNNTELSTKELNTILEAIKTTPSSCGRRGVDVAIHTHRDEKAILAGLLVGGVGWLHRGQAILLLFADKKCYKNPVEIDTMPYLDAGVMIQAAYLAAEAMNIGCCFVNPNVRKENQGFFFERFIMDSDKIFCGAIVLGKYDLKHV